MKENSSHVEEILPSISVDCVIFGYSNNELKVLLRKELVPENDKVFEEWKLPGNHIFRNEMIDATATRILKEQTGLNIFFSKQFMVFSDPNRLTKRQRDYEWIKPSLLDNRVITIGFYALVNINDVDNSTIVDDAKWMNIYDVSELMFDHNQIFDEALKKLRDDLLHEPLVFELLPEKFTLTKMQNLYEVIFNTTYDKRNFRRKINKMHYLKPLEEFEQGVSHKPARLYLFDKALYETTRFERFDFRV